MTRTSRDHPFRTSLRGQDGPFRVSRNPTAATTQPATIAIAFIRHQTWSAIRTAENMVPASVGVREAGRARDPARARSRRSKRRRSLRVGGEETAPGAWTNVPPLVDQRAGQPSAKSATKSIADRTPTGRPPSSTATRRWTRPSHMTRAASSSVEVIVTVTAGDVMSSPTRIPDA